MTLLDVMIAVGGLTDFADGNGASILRTAEGNKQYSVRIRDLVKRGDVSANVEMRPGDVLIIPQAGSDLPSTRSAGRSERLVAGAHHDRDPWKNS